MATKQFLIITLGYTFFVCSLINIISNNIYFEVCYGNAILIAVYFLTAVTLAFVYMVFATKFYFNSVKAEISEAWNGIADTHIALPNQDAFKKTNQKLEFEESGKSKAEKETSNSQLNKVEDNKPRIKQINYIKLSKNLVGKIYYKAKVLSEDSYNDFYQRLTKKFPSNLIERKNELYIETQLLNQVASFGQNSKHCTELYEMRNGKLLKMFR